MMRKATNTLETIPFFAGLSAEALDKIATVARWGQVKNGQTIISHDDYHTDVCFAVKGRLQVQLFAPNGRLIILRDIVEGEHVGELAAMRDSARASTLVAKSDCLIASLTRTQFIDILREHPILMERLTRKLANWVCALNAQLFETVALNVRGRVLTYLWRQALQGRRTEVGLLIQPAPTHEIIANQVGTHREAVTRTLNELSKDGILEKSRGVIHILEEEKLASMLDQLLGWRVPRYGEPGFGL